MKLGWYDAGDVQAGWSVKGIGLVQWAEVFEDGYGKAVTLKTAQDRHTLSVSHPVWVYAVNSVPRASSPAVL